MAKNKKTKKSSPTPDDSEIPRRPGSAVSQQFLPKKQQNATSNWRKHQQQQRNGEEENCNVNNNTYGYVPFKTAPLPMYGIRANNIINKSSGSNNNSNSAAGSVNSGKLLNNNRTNVNNNNNNRVPFTTSAYAPFRADSSMSVRTAGAGSELGMYKSSSRYQSYTTLPRPEHIDIEVDDFRNHQQQIFAQEQPIYGIYDPSAIYGGALKAPTFTPAGGNAKGSRPPSALAAASIKSMPLYGGVSAVGMDSFGMTMPPLEPLNKTVTAHVADDIYRVGLKPIINWNILNLSSYLQIVLAAGLIGAGGLRIFLRFENSQSYELVYGISALLTAIVGLFAVRQRGYALVFVTFVQSVVNVLYFPVVSFQSGVLPLLWTSTKSIKALTASPHAGATTAASNVFIDAFEMDMAVSVLSILEFMAALVAAFYGCKAIGALAYHVEAMRLLVHYGGNSGTAAPHYFAPCVSEGYRSAPAAPPPIIPYARNDSALSKRPL